jgi:hypothetical protein
MPAISFPWWLPLLLIGQPIKSSGAFQLRRLSQYLASIYLLLIELSIGLKATNYQGTASGADLSRIDALWLSIKKCCADGYQAQEI